MNSKIRAVLSTFFESNTLRIPNFSRMKKILFLVLFSTMIFQSAQSQSTPSEPGLDDQFKSMLTNDYFRVNMLVQSVARFSFEDDNFLGGRGFSLPNARVSLRGNIDGGFYYRVFVNMASEPNLLDAFVGYRYDERFRITAGAQKPSQTLDFTPPPQNIEFISRARITGQLVQSREIGVSAQGDLNNLYYFLGVFNGNRLRSNNNNRFYTIGRLQYTINDVIPGFIKIAANGSFGNSSGVQSGNAGPVLGGERTIFGVDLHAETVKVMIKAEYLTGNLELPVALLEETISGYYLTGGYKVRDNVQLLARYQTVFYELSDFWESQITLGIKRQVTSLISFRANLDFYSPKVGDTQQGASMMMQFNF
jgi:hypothetical protein